MEKMKEFCGVEAYQIKVDMKKKIKEHFGTGVVITGLHGRENVVTFKTSAATFSINS